MLDVLAQVSKIKNKNLETSQNYWCQKGDMNQVPYTLEVSEAQQNAAHFC